MFVSGLGRLDYIQGEKSIVVTVHTSSMLPVHIVKSEEADTFYKENVGTDILGVPLGDGERLSALPPLVGKEYYLNAIDMKTASADIQLSSLGWVSFCIPRGLTVGIKAYVPGGKGVSIREPALLPSAKVSVVLEFVEMLCINSRSLYRSRTTVSYINRKFEVNIDKHDSFSS
ncbi:hypothetical protein ScPMuIL_005323 [Solemya velum]